MTSALSSITAGEIGNLVLAILAFIPAAVCTGYLAAWCVNLFGFRERSALERLAWSVPLSLGLSTIASVLLSRFFSLGVASAVFAACAAAWIALVTWEGLRRRGDAAPKRAGRSPFTAWTLALATAWAAVVILSLVDFVRGQRLYMSATVWDLSFRVGWVESVLRTGVPPLNPLYLFHHPATMRTYYFHYVLCAAVARMAHLSARAAFNASCVWSGYALVALIALYLKYFLNAGARLGRQLLMAVALLLVTGLDLGVVLWARLVDGRPFPPDLEWWSAGEITSWCDSLLWVPHHVLAMLCCMFALLVAWMDARAIRARHLGTTILIACSLAAAFGLSVYVAFAFFVIAVAWGAWLLLVERNPRPALRLAPGGVGAAVLLVPYLWELTHTESWIRGGSVFGFAVREMFDPGRLLAWAPLRHMAETHSFRARNFANLILLGPGYVVEMGFLLVVLLIYLVPAWRGRRPLSPAERSLVFLSTATFVLITFVRSWVSQTNDLGWRGALFLQFCTLLLASDLCLRWLRPGHASDGSGETNPPPESPRWLRGIAFAAIVIGIAGTVFQLSMLRLALTLNQKPLAAGQSLDTDRLSHTAFISAVGYAELNSRIARDAVVQADPLRRDDFIHTPDMLDIGHQTAIYSSVELECGSQWGGDPAGCPLMAAEIGPLFEDASAAQARAVCARYGIGYLVTRIYDPAWNDKNGWVWNLKPVVADPDFRALDCRAENELR